jgi:hypothetical protein
MAILFVAVVPKLTFVINSDASVSLSVISASSTWDSSCFCDSTCSFWTSVSSPGLLKSPRGGKRLLVGLCLKRLGRAVGRESFGFAVVSSSLRLFSGFIGFLWLNFLATGVVFGASVEAGGDRTGSKGLLNLKDDCCLLKVVASVTVVGSFLVVSATSVRFASPLSVKLLSKSLNVLSWNSGFGVVMVDDLEKNGRLEVGRILNLALPGSTDDGVPAFPKLDLAGAENEFRLALKPPPLRDELPNGYDDVAVG